MVQSSLHVLPKYFILMVETKYVKRVWQSFKRNQLGYCFFKSRYWIYFRWGWGALPLFVRSPWFLILDGAKWKLLVRWWIWWWWHWQWQQQQRRPPHRLLPQRGSQQRQPQKDNNNKDNKINEGNSFSSSTLKYVEWPPNCRILFKKIIL